MPLIFLFVISVLCRILVTGAKSRASQQRPTLYGLILWFPWGMAESSRDISGLGLEALKVLLVQALEDNARLKAETVELREEIARLKSLWRMTHGP